MFILFFILSFFATNSLDGMVKQRSIMVPVFIDQLEKAAQNNVFETCKWNPQSKMYQRSKCIIDILWLRMQSELTTVFNPIDHPDFEWNYHDCPTQMPDYKRITIFHHIFSTFYDAFKKGTVKDLGWSKDGQGFVFLRYACEELKKHLH